MPTLYISDDENKAQRLKDCMTDSMWRQVVVDYADDNYLELESGKIIRDTAEIIAFLKQPLTFSEKLGNARTAAVKAFHQLTSSGQLRAPKEIIAHRREMCAACPFNVPRTLGRVCTQCGCNIKAKTLLVSEICPLDPPKW